MPNKFNDLNFPALPTRRDSIRLLAGGAVCLAVDTSVLAQATGQVSAAQTAAGQAVGHEDAAVALANTASANPWSSHDTPAMVAAALVGLPPIPAGPYQPTWESIGANYKDPEWLRDGKFGIYMHLGIFSVPAHASEWYVRYMYGGNAGVMQWHTEHYGPPTQFGYKDFFPMYTMAKWDPDAWAALFKKAGAKYVLAPGEHHDGFSNWDSATNPYNSVNYGPHRDIDGDLIKALRKVGLEAGISDHSAYHFNFIPALAGSDEFDPKWANFYNVADKSVAARTKFLHDWVAKRIETIEKYKPDMLWFDMSTDHSWDPLKTYVAAYYYNRAVQWGKPVCISAKGAAWVSGQVMDYEREGRSPMELVDWVWQPDDPITDKFGYVEGQKVFGPDQFVAKIVENSSKNGNLLLNISPMADGAIPRNQQDVLLKIGSWLDINGEAIYGTRPWTHFKEDGAPQWHFTTKQAMNSTVVVDLLMEGVRTMLLTQQFTPERIPRRLPGFYGTTKATPVARVKDSRYAIAQLHDIAPVLVDQ